MKETHLDILEYARHDAHGMVILHRIMYGLFTIDVKIVGKMMSPSSLRGSGNKMFLISITWMIKTMMI